MTRSGSRGGSHQGRGGDIRKTREGQGHAHDFSGEHAFAAAEIDPVAIDVISLGFIEARQRDGGGNLREFEGAFGVGQGAGAGGGGGGEELDGEGVAAIGDDEAFENIFAVAQFRDVCFFSAFRTLHELCGGGREAGECDGAFDAVNGRLAGELCHKFVRLIIWLNGFKDGPGAEGDFVNEQGFGLFDRHPQHA